MSALQAKKWEVCLQLFGELGRQGLKASARSTGVDTAYTDVHVHIGSVIMGKKVNKDKLRVVPYTDTILARKFNVLDT